MDALEKALDGLNEAQREAVDYVEGPLLVIAGPGTGKTQLLSLRAANILAKCDVAPYNILCLTYTDAGATEMRDRLISLIGKDAYGVEVSTFHSFASSIRTRYPEYFDSNPNATPISGLHAKEIVDKLLKALPYDNPLAGTYSGVAVHLSEAMGFMSTMKRAGLLPSELKAIMEQNIAFADYLENETEVFSHLNNPMPRKKAEKEEYVAAFEEILSAACHLAPAQLTTSVVSTPGIYEPYAVWLASLLGTTVLIDEEGKTAGFQSLRNAIAEKNDAKVYVSKLRRASLKSLAAIEIFEGYQKQLIQEGLIDFDDMVMDSIKAIREHPQLRYALQERYKFIQVDEFQDTNGAQMRIVELLCEGIDAPNVMAVGDDDQAIMRFQGATIACINQFQELYHPKNVVLKINYRSTTEIVELGKDIAKQVQRRLPASETDKEIVANNGPGDQAEFVEKVFENQELEYYKIAKDIREKIDEGFIDTCKNPDKAIAVIACKHASLKKLIPYLREQNIPFTYKSTAELFALESMQTLLAMVRFVAAYAVGRKELAESYLPQIIASAELGGTSASSVAFALFARREYFGEWMQAMAATEDERIKKIHKHLLEWSSLMQATSVREMLFCIAKPCLTYYEKISQSDPLACAEFNGGMRALVKFAQDELSVACSLGRTLRLGDLVERLDRALLFNESIDASINLNTPGAVRLTSAHGSKGLEFDLTYVMDADDHTWHSGKPASGVYPSNLYIGDEPDEDDARRLLFVAVTRAKRYLELYRAGGNTLRELQERIKTVNAEMDASDLSSAIETSWHGCYALDTPEMQALLAPNLPPRSLSASSLNAFVDFNEESPEVSAFPDKYVLRLPMAPNVAMEFGTKVHAFLEDYVNRVVKTSITTVEDLAEQYHIAISRLDFPQEDLAPYVQRFKRIVAQFDEWARPRLEGRLATEVKISALVGDDVPLFGVCDLLVIDDDQKTIRVIDYKTGFGYPQGSPKRGYERQLQFYRLLIENSSEFAGYHVITCENWYVEPARDEQRSIHDPVVASVSDADIAYLTLLVNAAWHCIERGDFDISAFSQSEQYLAACGELAAKTKRVTKKERELALQLAFETWLIERDANEHCVE